MADITLGDLWHAEKIDASFIEKHNVSWVIVNTDVGSIVTREIRRDFFVTKIETQKEIIYNQSYCYSSKHHRNRTKFFNSFVQEDIEISPLINQCIKVGFIEKVFNKMNKIIQQKFKK